MKELDLIDELLFSSRSVEFERMRDGQVNAVINDVYFGRGGNAISAFKNARAAMLKRVE